LNTKQSIGQSMQLEGAHSMLLGCSALWQCKQMGRLSRTEDCSI